MRVRFDGLVFVASSQRERMNANVESLFNLEQNLKQQGYDLLKVPYVLQLNKRDLPNLISANDLKAELQRKTEPVFEGVANCGIGVFDTLEALAKQVLLGLRKNGGGWSYFGVSILPRFLTKTKLAMIL